jgi:radical SAM protein with 4Fe4S-binding SPASM domain
MKPFRLLNKFGRHTGTVGEILSPITDNRIVPYPFIMAWVVTRRCNSRCQMCSIWQDDHSTALTLEQAVRIFTTNDLSFVRSLTITGGEPTLRKDLFDLFQIAIDSLENLDHLQLATHGMHTRRVADIAAKVSAYLANQGRKKTVLEFQISLDGVGEVHNTIRGIPNFFDRVQETLRELKALQRHYPLKIKLSSVLMPYNLPFMADLREFARSNRLPIHISPVIFSEQYYENTHMLAQLAFLNQEDKDAAREFFETLGKEDQTSLRFYYQDVSKMMVGAERGRRCMLGFYGFTLEHDGNVYPCINCEVNSFGNLLQEPFEAIWFGESSSEVRRLLRKNCCPTCTTMCYPNVVNLREKVEILWRERKSNHP